MIEPSQKEAQTEIPQDQAVGLTSALLARRREFLNALAAIDTEILEIQTELNQRLETVRHRRQPLEVALAHLDALLRIEGWTDPDGGEVGHSQVIKSNGAIPADAAYDLLTTLEIPLHYRSLAQQLSDSGIYVGGKDPAATLLSKISRDDRFKRSPERGVYGLATWSMRKASGGKGKSNSRRPKKTRS